MGSFHFSSQSAFYFSQALTKSWIYYGKDLSEPSAVSDLTIMLLRFAVMKYRFLAIITDDIKFHNKCNNRKK